MAQTITPLPGEKISLADYDPDSTAWVADKAAGRKELRENTQRLRDLSYRLWAERQRSVLLILQGMDTAGKDGTIRHVMRGINPQMCQVTSFREPSPDELDHDFLWRIHRAVPRQGTIGIFNRSQYEDVLVVRVHGLVPEHVWQVHYDQINQFEQLLTSGTTTIVKCFLHISKDEQRKRLQKRLDRPDKCWKFSRRDIAERKLWDEYQRAYEDALTRCNTPHAPWHIIPADHKWYRNVLVSRILRETLEQLDPQFPACEADLPEKVE